MKTRPSALSNWDEVQHDPLTLPPDDFSDLSVDDAVELIKAWFLENFEDPAENTPYDGGEGGYQYIWGGPYDARDIVQDIFTDTASSEIVEQAIDALEALSAWWVPNSTRLQPPDEDETDWPNDASALHAELLVRLTALEKAVEALPAASPAGIGHNQPPEQIEPIPYSLQVKIEIEAAIAVLKVQPVEPVDNGAAAVEAAKVLRENGSSIRSWLARHADSFTTEFSKESGKQIAKWGWPALFAIVVEYILNISAVVGKWLAALDVGLPF